LSREGSLSCHTYCDTGPRFIRSHPKDRHPRLTMGFEPPTQGSSDLCARRSNHFASRATHKYSYPPSKSTCQEQRNYWYETRQTTFSSMKVCNH
jgi:hypothetical protein